MPDRGLLEAGELRAPSLAQTLPGPWALEGARWAQLTYEVEQAAALARLPADATRPVPTYARLFVLEAASSPAGPLRLAVLMAGARYRLFPRNVLVDAVVDGPVAEVSAAFGAPFRAGSVSLLREAARLEATVAGEDGELARLTLPALYAIDPGMLRWDAWLGFAQQDGKVALTEYGARPGRCEAWLSKGATLETPGSLPRGHVWRTLRNLNTVSACYLEGEVEFTAPEFQQAL